MNKEEAFKSFCITDDEKGKNEVAASLSSTICFHAYG